MTDTSVLILGGGTIGSQLGVILHSHGMHVDCADPHLDGVGLRVDVLKQPDYIHGYNYVINTIPVHDPYRLTGLLIACIKHGVHYLDCNEDVRVGEFIWQFGNTQNDVLFAPHCGLAPGLINILGARLAHTGALNELDLRVGALTRLVDNEVRYTPTWSPAGLVNQYLNDYTLVQFGLPVRCESIFTKSTGSDFYHEFYLDGVPYECFPTSGGLGSMADMKGIPASVMYRSIRLPGHRDLMQQVIRRENYDRARIIAEMRKYRAHKADDYVYAVVIGRSHEGTTSVVWRADAKTGYMGHSMTAIQKCTIGPIAAVLDLHKRERLQSGFVHQHEIDWADFRQSPFIDRIGFEESY